MAGGVNRVRWNSLFANKIKGIRPWTGGANRKSRRIFPRHRSEAPGSKPTGRHRRAARTRDPCELMTLADGALDLSSHAPYRNFVWGAEVELLKEVRRFTTAEPRR
jgi:hypothetical protein